MSNQLNADTLKFVKEGLEFIKAKEPEYNRVASKMPKSSLDVILSDNFGWAELYELPVRHTVILLLWSLGFNEAIQRYSQLDQTMSATEAIIKYVAETIKDETSFSNDIFNNASEPKTLAEIKSLQLGKTGIFTLSDFFALQSCLLFQIEALKKHGKYMSELVEDVKNGEDGSFWIAVRTDPTVLGCNIFSRRMSLASLHKDDKFFQLLGTAIKTKWKKPKKDLDVLRVILQVCLESKWLDDLSQSDEDRLFIKTLNVYSDDGDDPARSLHKFIYRWKNNK